MALFDQLKALHDVYFLQRMFSPSSGYFFLS